MRLPLILFLAAIPLLAWDPAPRLAPLLGVPYVNDAVQDERGRWTTFTHPDRIQPGPGFNCSGFVLAASRRLLDYHGSLDQAARDRLGDSGPGAKLGQDWDFAWDLILNLSEGRSRRVILPESESRLEGQTGLSLRGFPLADAKAWKAVLPKFRERCLYLASLSRTEKGRIQHYHAVCFVKDGQGRVWLYQTLPFGHSHRLCISDPTGMARMQAMFGHGKQILILEVEAA